MEFLHVKFDVCVLLFHACLSLECAEGKKHEWSMGENEMKLWMNEENEKKMKLMKCYELCSPLLVVTLEIFGRALQAGPGESLGAKCAG